MTDQTTVEEGRRAVTVLVKSLAAVPWNARRTIDAEGVRELAASIEREGLLQPLVVRKQRSSNTEGEWDGYQVICGARRLAALQLLKYEKAACWLVDADDARAKLMNLAENVQRESLTALEEAEAFGRLLADGMAVDQIALEIGKSHDPAYVYQRLRLSKLVPKWRKELEGRRIATGVALEVARVPEETQKILAEHFLDRYGEAEAVTVRQVREWVRQHEMLPLRRAVWSLADPALDGGACQDCPKRTGAAVELFPDFARGKDKIGDACLDLRCWKRKEDQVIEAARKAHPDLMDLKGWEEGEKWKRAAKGTTRGVIVQPGFDENPLPRGTVLTIETIRRKELPMVDGAPRADAKKLRQQMEIRRRTVKAVAERILEGAVIQRSVWEAAVKTLCGRIMNDDRRALCKALEIEVPKSAHGSPDFEKALNGVFLKGEDATTGVFVVMAIACMASGRFVDRKNDPLQGFAKTLKVDVAGIAEAVKAGKAKKAKAEKGSKAATKKK